MPRTRHQGKLSNRGLLRPTLALTLLGQLILTVLLGACDISEPRLPSFDSRLTIPLGTERFTVGEAIAEEPDLVVDADGGINFVTANSPDTLSLGMDLNIEIPGQHINQTIGSFSVSDPAPVIITRSLPDAWPEAATLVDISTPLAPFDFAIEAPDLQLAGIEACTISAGTMTVDITSTWPVGISGSGAEDPLVLTMFDGTTGEILLTLPVGPVPANGSITTATSLAGVILSSTLKMTVTGHGDGTGEQPVTLAGDEELALQINFSNLIATSATAAIEPQVFSVSFVTDLADQDEISTAEFSSGTLAMQLSNQLPFPVSVDLNWDQVIDPMGSPLSVTTEIPAQGSTNLSIPFAGCRLESQATPLTSLTAHVLARTSGSNGQLITLTSTQGFSADLEPGVLSFSQISGCFTPASWDLEPSAEQISYPQDSAGLLFTRATLTISLENSAALGADLDLTLTGIPSHGQPVTLEIHDRVDPAGQSATKTVLVIDENNSDLIPFLNSRPGIITLAGTMSLIPGANCGTVLSSDHMIVAWNLEVPLVVTLDEVTLSGETTPLGLDTTVQDMIRDRAGAAEFHAEVVNHIPAGLELQVLLATDPANLPEHPDLIIGPLVIASALVDPLSGEVSTTVTSRPVVNLEPTETAVFGEPGLHVMYRVSLPAAGDVPVRVLSTDYLEISGTVSLDLLVAEEL